MLKILKKDKSRKTYKQVLAEQNNLEAPNHKSKPIGNQTTESAPPDQLKQSYEQLFQEFEDNFKLKYKPALPPKGKKPIQRVIHPELACMRKNKKTKMRQNDGSAKKNIRQLSTEISEERFVSKRKKSMRRKNTSTSRKSHNKYKQEIFNLKGQIFSSHFPITMKRSQSFKFIPFTNRPRDHFNNGCFSQEGKKKLRYN